MNKTLDYIFPNPPKGLDPAALDPQAIPEHVAVIMDGNGRWAKKRALNRLKGHKAGIEAVRETIRSHHLFILNRELEAPSGRGHWPDGPVRQDHAGGGRWPA